jgi:hypothetical protein
MLFIHGHEACTNNQCPMFGLNQADCCEGETAATPSTPVVAAVHFGPPHAHEEEEP